MARLNGDEMRVVCWSGDGGTYDIGLASLSAAAERNEDILYVCYDNEIYGNTGGQRSSATPAGAATTNTPQGKPEPKKDIFAIMAAHRIPYAATVSLADPEDARRKIRRALAETGFRFLLILAPCPTGWKSEPSMTVELVRLAWCRWGFSLSWKWKTAGNGQSMWSLIFPCLRWSNMSPCNAVSGNQPLILKCWPLTFSGSGRNCGPGPGWESGSEEGGRNISGGRGFLKKAPSPGPPSEKTFKIWALTARIG